MENFIVSARKYRPATFGSVVGQSALTATLKNAIKNNHLAHAYLFCGPRGVGKTTCARIFAKTINCLHLTPDYEACNECESCVAFNEGRSYNIHELDAASNNGVDDIRSLIEQVRIPPQVGRYSVYIIDEVHMLSQGAFNAFLKTLEEPPAHAIFILATTEKHKIIPTILSRTQIYDFNRITIADTVAHLRYVAGQEGVEADENALHVIAQKSDGGMRDALSIFDQIVSFSGNRVTYQDVITNLNVLDYEYYFRLVDAFLAGDVSRSLLIFNEILEKGFEAQHFVGGLAAHLRDVLVCKDPQTLVLLEVGADIRERYKEQAARCPADFLFQALRLANDCDLNYRASRNKRLLVELTLIQLCQLSHPADDGKKKAQLAPIETSAQPATATTQPAKPQAREITPPAGNTQTFVSHTPHITPPSTTDSTATKRTGRPPMAASLKDIAQPKAPANVQPTSSSYQKVKRDTPFTQEQLEVAWKTYAGTIDKKVYLKNIMLNNTPHLQDQALFEVGVHNPGMQDELANNATDILSVLREWLQNDHLQMRVRILESNEKHLAYTSKEKLDHMLEINPLLNKLITNFKLRTE